MLRSVFTLNLLVVLSLPGCEKPVPPQIPPPSVTVSKPLVQNVSKYAELIGRSEASQVFEARARVQGFLDKSHVAEGTDVEAEAVLFEIEKEPIQAEIAAAEAALASSKAKRDVAVADRDRAEQLYEKKVTTLAELQRFRANVAVLEAEIQTNQEVIKEAKIRLGYTTIKSKINGMIGEVYIDEGNLVGTSDTTLLATVQQYDPLYIYFDAPEGVLLKHLREIAEGIREKNSDMELEVQFTGEVGFPHQGTLKMFDNEIDRSTGTTLLRGEIPNPDKKALPGAYAKIRIRSKNDTFNDAVLVDERAIGTDLSGKYLLIVNDQNIVEQRRVLLGQRYHQFRHVVAMWDPSEAQPDPEASELPPIPADFRYILQGLQKARPGNPVEVSQEVMLEYPKESESANMIEPEPKETES